MNLKEYTRLIAVLDATWKAGERCRDCGHQYSDKQRLEHFGTPCVLEQNGCAIIEGEDVIESCPGVRAEMEAARTGCLNRKYRRAANGRFY